MASPLAVIRLKSARARKHFDQFKSLMGYGPNPLAPPKLISIHLNRDGTLECITNDPSKPDPEASLALGDAIHQLRSSLDHLLYALVARRHSCDAFEKFRLLFPISKDPHDFCKYHFVANGTLRCLIGAREFEVIEQAQPYKRDPINSDTDPLYILGKLDNIDKHRIVLELKHTVSTAGTIVPQGLPPVPFKVTKHPVVSETQVIPIGVNIPDGPYQMSVDTVAQFIVVSEFDSKHVFGWFRPAEDIVNGIIDSCEPFFP